MRFRVTSGGKLLSDADPQTIGAENCKRRVNIRRDDDAEVLMPGWSDYGDLPDVTHLFRAARPNGDRAVLAFTDTRIFKREIWGWNVLASGFQPSSVWDIVNIDGYVVINNGKDLPHYWDWVNPVAPIKEFREQGIARVGVLWEASNFLMMADITELSVDSLTKWMEGDSPYGYIPDGTDGLTRTPSRVAWTDKTTELGLTIKANTYEGSSEIALAFPCESIKPGDRVNYTQTHQGADGITVFITDAEVEAVEQNRIWLKDYNAPDYTVGIIQRSDYNQRIVGYDDLIGDGSPILWGGMLGKYQVIVRETAIITGQLNESVSSYVQAPPFFFQTTYEGLSCPTSKNLIEHVGSNSLFYYSRGGFYEYNLRSQTPNKVEVFDVNESLFAGLNEETAKLIDNEPQKELWIFLDDRTLVFDYENSLLSEVDNVFKTAGLVDDPNDFYGGVNRVFVLSDGDRVVKMEEGLYTRLGLEYEGILQYGWIGDTGGMTDVKLRRYIPEGNGVIELKIDRVRSDKKELCVLPKVPIELGYAMQINLRSQWIQDTIYLNDGDSRLIARDVELIRTENRRRGYVESR